MDCYSGINFWHLFSQPQFFGIKILREIIKINSAINWLFAGDLEERGGHMRGSQPTPRTMQSEK